MQDNTSPTPNQPNATVPPQPAQTSPTLSPTPQGAPNNNKKKWFIIGGVVVILAIVVVILMLIFNSSNKTNNGNSPANSSQPTELTVGQNPFYEPCSIVREQDFRQAFALQGPENIGVITHTTALPQLNSSGKADVFASPQKNSDRFDSDCDLTLSPAPTATRLTSIRARVVQFKEASKAVSSLKSQRNFNAPEGGELPPVPSFTAENSFLKLPKDGLSTIEATIVHQNLLITYSYLLSDGESADATVPKIANLATATVQNIDNKDTAKKSGDISGHSTMTNRPFKDVCYNVDFSKVKQTLGQIEFSLTATVVDQYGALKGSSAEGDGVQSHCSVDYGPVRDDNKQSNKSSTRVTAQDAYPHTLILETNGFATAGEANAAFAADKNRSASSSNKPTIEDISGLGDVAYKTTLETEIPDFSADGSNKKSIVQEVYKIVKGDTMYMLQFEQAKSSKATPVQIQTAQVKAIYENLQNSSK